MVKPKKPRVPISIYKALFVSLWLLTAIGAARGFIRLGSTTDPARVLAGVDPNVAPWWDLTLLPEIGASSAHAIVEFRAAAPIEGRNPVFREVVDLTRIKGIGPRTVQRLGPYLRLEPVPEPAIHKTPE